MNSEVAWIDRTGSSFVTVTGTERIDFLHRITSNDLTALKAGEGMQTVLLTEKARIIDVLTVMQSDDYARLVFSKGASKGVLAWLRKYVIMEDLRFADLTPDSQMIELTGPRAGQLVKDVLKVDVGTLPLCSFIDYDTVTIVRMPSMWETSYYIIRAGNPLGKAGSVPHSERSESGVTSDNNNMYDSVVEALKSNSTEVPELTSDEVEVLRIKKGIGERGKEWTDAYNPLEASLLHLTSFTKGCYIGQEVISRLDSYNKVKQRLMGLVGDEIVSQHDIIEQAEQSVGVVTSAAFDPQSGKTVALCYIRGEHAHHGTPVTVRHNGLLIQMQLQTFPLEI